MASTVRTDEVRLPDRRAAKLWQGRPGLRALLPRHPRLAPGRPAAGRRRPRCRRAAGRGEPSRLRPLRPRRLRPPQRRRRHGGDRRRPGDRVLRRPRDERRRSVRPRLRGPATPTGSPPPAPSRPGRGTRPGAHRCPATAWTRRARRSSRASRWARSRTTSLRSGRTSRPTSPAMAPEDPDDDSLAARLVARLPSSTGRWSPGCPAHQTAAAVREALARPDGYLRDAAIAFGTGTSLPADVRCPTWLWYGSHDPQATVRNGCGSRADPRRDAGDPGGRRAPRHAPAALVAILATLAQPWSRDLTQGRASVVGEQRRRDRALVPAGPAQAPSQAWARMPTDRLSTNSPRASGGWKPSSP